MFKMSIPELEKDGAAALARSSVCFLPISVDQPYNEGQDWDETISLINSHFAACVIVVVDDLHRFTQTMRNDELSDADARNRALQDGDNWIRQTNENWARKKTKKRSKGFHPGLTIPYTITR